MSGLLVSLQGAVAQGVLWGIMVLGVYITFRLMDIADMTVDGSFALGACVCAVLVVNKGVNPVLALLVAAAAGVVAGAVTGILHTVFEIPAILAGILTQISLWSINLRIMGGKSNLPLLKVKTLISGLAASFGMTQAQASMIVGIVLAVAAILFLYWFFGTEIGSAMRATGNNEDMVRALGVDTRMMKLLSLMVSNGLVGLSGALVCQSQKYGDVGSGTGMGLERLAVIVQDVDSLFTVDTNKALLDRVCELAHTEYQKDHETDISLRIVADHIKSCTFMISDGIMPSNEGRGYVLRRLLRRAARHGKKLGIEGEFLAALSRTVIDLSKDGYPELEEKSAMIFKVLSEEEDKFNRTIDQGLAILADMEEDMNKNGEKVLSGDNAFKLYDTYGFPIDLTREILEEKSLGIDEDGFNAAMKRQKDQARAARKTTNYMGADVTVYQSIDPAITTEFIGYDRLTAESEISVLTTEDEIVEALTDGQTGTIITKETPFYGTMGGQEGDFGQITAPDGSVFEVKDTIHLQGGKIGHVGVVTKGMFEVGEKVTMSVDKENRELTSRNHSATHLLHKALRTVLGSHVEQAGSLVTRDRLRFDFTHFSAMTPEEIAKVEKIVNDEIAASLPVVTDVMSLEEAKKTGAMALFGEKYGEKVRVVKMGDFSTELCGGTHVSNTGTIASFKILSEAGIAAGVRRIEALTSTGLMNHYKEVENELHEAAKLAKTTPAALSSKIESMLEEIKTLHAENEKLKSKLANDSLGDVMNQVQDVNGVKLLAVEVKDVDMNGLRNLGDQLKEKLGDGVVLIASTLDGKVSLMASVTDGAMKKGAHAGNLIKAIAGLVGGGGGGRPNMAQAGGKNPAGIAAALEKAAEVVAEQVK